MHPPFLNRMLSGWRVDPSSLVRWGNVVLAGGSVLLALYVAGSGMRSILSARSGSRNEFELTQEPPTKNKRTAAAFDVLALKDLTRRNLFVPLIAPAPVRKIIPIAVPIVPVVPKIPISQKASHLRLVGIMNGDPVQAILEDDQNHKTLYVTVGQTIGDLQIDKILADRVVLSSGDEHMDLML